MADKTQEQIQQHPLTGEFRNNGKNMFYLNELNNGIIHLLIEKPKSMPKPALLSSQHCGCDS
jgi:hypothetical protein